MFTSSEMDSNSKDTSAIFQIEFYINKICVVHFYSMQNNKPSTLISISSTLPVTLLNLKYEVLPTAEEASDWPLTTIRSGSVKTGALKGEPVGILRLSYHRMVSESIHSTWHCFLIKCYGDDVINSLQRNKADCKASTSLRMNFGWNVASTRTNRDLQIAFSSLTRVHC